MKKNVWRIELILATDERVPVRPEHIGLFKLSDIRTDIERMSPGYNGLSATMRCSSMLLELLPNADAPLEDGERTLFSRIADGQDIRQIEVQYWGGGDNFDDIAVPWNTDGMDAEKRNSFQRAFLEGGHCFVY